MNPFNNNLMRSKAAFTLIEMMVVIGIISIISAIAIPNMIAWRNNSQFNSSVRSVKSAVDKVRMASIKSNMPTRIDFTVGGHTFDILEWDINIIPNAYAPADTYQLSPGTTISAAAFGANTWLEFNSRGMPNAGSGSLTLQNSNGLSANIVVDPMGACKIQ
ncbi:MAG: prepilin-type N-terminal cleavage/methylation domain-containing protein [Desulfamplus sp.]|nr:prepilin-type N-terminal cleavage/methylation domain-containing protein [Desulfamplus sp.]